MIRILLVFCAIALHTGAMAQILLDNSPSARDPVTGEYFYETVFKGRIVDSLTRQPLPSAVISVVGKGYLDRTAVRQYVADKEGRFRFTCRVGPSNRMEINHLGHSIRTVYLKTDAPERDLGDVWLAEDPTGIDAVVVRSRLKMYEMKGDTIVYIPKAVKTMEGEKALEIMRQMPGVEVSESGSVTIFGEKVERTYVNSRLLFGEDPTTALKQLEAEEVASIQSYDEVDEREAALHGKNARKRKVLNVVTFKDFSKSFAANAHIEAGAGFEQDVEGNRPARYNAKADAGFYSEALQVALSGGSNNLARHNLGKPLPGLRRQSNANASVSGSVDKHRYNFSYRYNTTTDEQSATSERNYFASEHYTSRFQADTTRKKNETGQHSLSAGYVYNGEKTFFDTSLSGSFYNRTGTDFRRQRATQDGAPLFDMLRTIESWGNSSRIQWSSHFDRRIKENQRFNIAVYFDYSDTDNNENRRETQTESEQQTNTELVFRNAAPAPQISASGSVAYSFNFDKGGELTFKTEVEHTGNEQRIKAFDPQTEELDRALSTLATDRTLTGSAGIRYSLMRGNHILSIDPTYQLISLSHRDRLRASRDERVFHGLNASVNYHYRQPKGTTYLSLDASQRPPDMRYYSTRLDDTNPLHLSAGSPSLAPEKQYSASISHDGMIGQEGSLSISGSITLTTDAVILTRTYFDKDTPLKDYDDYLAPAGAWLTRPENWGNNINVNGSISYKRPIAPLKCFAEFRAYYFYQNPNEDTGQGAGPQRAQKHMGEFEVQLTSNFSSKFRITLDSKTNVNWFRNPDGYSNRNLSERVGATLRWDVNRFFVLGNYTYGIERNNTYTAADNDIHQLNLSLGCRFWDRNATLSFNAYDILNQQTGIRVGQGPTGVSISRERLYASYFTFAFEYKFNRRN